MQNLHKNKNMKEFSYCFKNIHLSSNCLENSMYLIFDISIQNFELNIKYVK